LAANALVFKEIVRAIYGAFFLMAIGLLVIDQSLNTA
jgi:hypothetical protein